MDYLQILLLILVSMIVYFILKDPKFTPMCKCGVNCKCIDCSGNCNCSNNSNSNSSNSKSTFSSMDPQKFISNNLDITDSARSIEIPRTRDSWKHFVTCNDIKFGEIGEKVTKGCKTKIRTSASTILQREDDVVDNVRVDSISTDDVS